MNGSKMICGSFKSEWKIKNRSSLSLPFFAIIGLMVLAVGIGKAQEVLQGVGSQKYIKKILFEITSDQLANYVKQEGATGTRNVLIGFDGQNNFGIMHLT